MLGYQQKGLSPKWHRVSKGEFWGNRMPEFGLYWTACHPNVSLTKCIPVTFTQVGRLLRVGKRGTVIIEEILPEKERPGPAMV